MNTSDILFEGLARLFLDGKEALKLYNRVDGKREYFIGSSSTNLVIKDHRAKTKSTSEVALPSPSNNSEFYQPAWTQVRYSEEDEALEIHLYDGEAKDDLPVLWFGILENNLMPGYKVEWEVFKVLEPQGTAFVALIP